MGVKLNENTSRFKDAEFVQNIDRLKDRECVQTNAGCEGIGVFVILRGLKKNRSFQIF